MAGPSDVVRPFQLPTNTPEQLYLSQYNLKDNTPIAVTPGFGGFAPGDLPPVQTGSGHFDISIGYYCAQAQAELKAEEA